MTTQLYTQLKNIDFSHLWHPFTQASVWFEDEPLIVERGEGMYLIDVEGKCYLDGVSSIWCTVHGHGHPALVAALKEQTEKVCHSTLLGLSHRPILELTEALRSLLPQELSRFFYCDGGTAAVEAGLRMALEWWQKQSSPAAKKKSRYLSLVGSYHGDTLGSVGVGYLEAFHGALRSVVSESVRMRPPIIFEREEGLCKEEALAAALAEAERVIGQHAESIAACIIEPHVQGAAGIWVHPSEYLAGVAALCRKHDILLVVDEVATGFGKTGKLFSFEHAEIVPDILIVGKGLSGGYAALSAAITTERIFEGFVGAPEELKTFFYGQTFGGNPLAAAVAKASVELFVKDEVVACGARLAGEMRSLLETHILPCSHVCEVRQFGVMCGIELTKTPGAYQPYPMSELAGVRITQEARKRGVIIRPLGNVMVLMPAPMMSGVEVEQLIAVTAESINAALGA